MSLAFDRDFHRALANEPHFAVDMMVCRMRCASWRQSGFVNLDGFSGSEPSLQDVASGHVWRFIHRKTGKRIDGRWQRTWRGLASLRHGQLRQGCGKEQGGRQERYEVTSGDGHGSPQVRLMPLARDLEFGRTAFPRAD